MEELPVLLGPVVPVEDEAADGLGVEVGFTSKLPSLLEIKREMLKGLFGLSLGL